MYVPKLNCTFIPENFPNLDSESIYLCIKNNELLIDSKTNNLVFLTKEEKKWSGMDASTSHFLGMLDDKLCYVEDLSKDSALLENTILQNMMSLLGRIPDNLFGLCSRAIQLSEWYRNNQYCSKCGSKMKKHPTETAMECEKKDSLVYQRISPCIIVLVTKQDKILLAHNKNFPGKLYSTLAGFIEAGETVEEAIHREIYEEVNIKITNLSYFGSQSWPFPSQLMLGFHAEYLSGDLKADNKEIDIVKWFNYKSLPETPSARISISGKLIESYVSKMYLNKLPAFR